jgi:hypothetical protein
MNRLLIAGIVIISTAPLYAQRQQQNVAKLKADARNVVGTIANDKAKTQTYCQILDLAHQLAQAAQEIMGPVAPGYAGEPCCDWCNQYGR